MKYLKWLKFTAENLLMFNVDGMIALLGLIGFVVWLCGYEEGFFAIGFTLYATYTTYRLRTAKDKIDKTNIE